MKKLRVCLAASGGGHLRQLVQMLPFARKHDYYFLTEATPLGLSLAKDHPARFVPHFAFGQRETDGFLKFAWAGISNFFASIWHFIVMRPDVVISTGAGAAFFTLVLAWATRRKVIYIESIARVESISMFGKLSARFADLYLVQWPGLVSQHPKAVYCNPFCQSEAPAHAKAHKLFATVGTVLPFDRMINSVHQLMQEGVITETVVAQTGESDIAPEGIEVHKTLPQDDMDRHLKESGIAIVHGGSGSMLGAIRAGCAVIAMPRRHDLGEHYDDHQFELVGAFRDQGLVFEARDVDSLREAIKAAREGKGKSVEIDPNAYARFIGGFLEGKAPVQS